MGGRNPRHKKNKSKKRGQNHERGIESPIPNMPSSNVAPTHGQPPLANDTYNQQQKHTEHQPQAKRQESTINGNRGSKMNFFGGLFFQVLFPVLFAVCFGLTIYYLQANKPKPASLMALSACVFLGLAIMIFIRIFWQPETEIHGYLIPANDLSPPNPCGDMPSGVVSIYLGTSLAYTSQFPFAVLTADQERLLVLDRTAEGIAVSLKIFSDDEKIVAEIVRNEFHINPNNYFRRERPDKHTLIIYDLHSHMVVNIRYLNPSAVKLTGMFRYPKRLPVQIAENQIKIGPLTFIEACFEESSINLEGP